MSFFREMCEELNSYLKARPGVRLFGLAVRQRDRGELLVAHATAERALQVLFGPGIIRDSPPAVSVIIMCTIVHAELCSRLARPVSVEIVLRTQTLIEPLDWVRDIDKERIARLLPEVPLNVHG